MKQMIVDLQNQKNKLILNLKFASFFSEFRIKKVNLTTVNA